MTGKNPIVSLLNGLLDHIPDPYISGQDNDLSKQFTHEVERYQQEAQRFQTIKQHLDEIPDKHMADGNFS